MKQEKSKGLAYALEVLLFPFGLAWFYLDKVVHGVIHLVFGVILGGFTARALYLLILGFRLQSIDPNRYNVENLIDNAPWIMIVIFIYFAWMVLDCLFLNDVIDGFNKSIEKENKSTTSLLSKIGLSNIVESKIGTQRALKTKVESRQEIDNRIMQDVVEEYYNSDLFQQFKNTYFKLTNSISDNQIKRSFQLVEDEQYEIALKYFEDLLVDGKESSFVYFGRSLAALEINTPEKILYYYRSLQKNNDFRRGEYIEDEGHKLYNLLTQLDHEINREYSARVAYQNAKKDENKLSYDQLMELLLPFKDKIDTSYFDELGEKRDSLYDEAQELEKDIEHQKKKSKVYQKIYQNYVWCGKYKNAESKAEDIQKLYDQALQKEKRAKKRKYIWIGITSVILLICCVIAGLFICKQLEKKEAIRSLDILNHSESAAVRKFCSDNHIEPTDFIWYVDTGQYSDGDDETIDIAYKSVPFGKKFKKSSYETNEGNRYYVDSVNSSEWDKAEDDSSYGE